MRALLPAATLAAALILATAGCQSPGSASGNATASSGSAASPSLSVSVSISQASVVPASQSASAAASVSPAHELTVYFAEGGDTNGTSMHASGCQAGCPLSGDGTTSLWNMTWPTWNPAEAIGTGTEKIDDCNPSCATGKLYPVKVTVTFRDPALVCTSTHVARYYWTRASFSWPDGLPTALSGDSAPVNPVTYANITAESKPTCG